MFPPPPPSGELILSMERLILQEGRWLLIRGPVYTVPLTARSACLLPGVSCQFPCPGKQLLWAWKEKHINHQQIAFSCLRLFLEFVFWTTHAKLGGSHNPAAVLPKDCSVSCLGQKIGPHHLCVEFYLPLKINTATCITAISQLTSMA